MRVWSFPPNAMIPGSRSRVPLLELLLGPSCASWISSEIGAVRNRAGCDPSPGEPDSSWLLAETRYVCEHERR